MTPSNTDSALLELAHALKASGYSFTTVTPATHERVNARPANRWAKDAKDVFGWSRPFHPDILPLQVWELMQRAKVVQAFEDGFRSSVRLSSLGGQEFWHSAFPTNEPDAVFFGPDTYRYALALNQLFASGLAPVKRAVDIGIGAGPGAILTALAFPGAQVFGVDINPKALRLTRINAALAGAEVEARESNLLNEVEGDFDLIVANPPYLVDASERAYRHGGGPLGAGLSLAILDCALERLTPTGTLLLYTGAAMMNGTDPFREAVEKRLAGIKAKWILREMDPDIFGEELENDAYAQCDRIAAVVLRVRKAV
jgi:methylase of polypeptide subunit release factors